MNLNPRISRPLLEILTSEAQLGGAFVVGGFVRDALMEEVSKDFDVEVFGLSLEALIQVLKRYGTVSLVGKSFGVIKVTVRSGETYDFSLPRRDSKVGKGHRGFAITVDPSMSPADAVTRRDFTLNALLYDPRRQLVFDYCGGLDDLEAKVLREVDRRTFGDDPLRVLRAMQFIARFDLSPSVSLVACARSMQGDYQELARERVCEEWMKWAATSRRPSAGLAFLRATRWLSHFPVIQSIVGVEQDPEWHPEGDVFEHTLHCCDALVQLPQWRGLGREDRMVSLLAVLLHDVGKASTSVVTHIEGRRRITSHGHERASAEGTEGFLKDLGMSQSVQRRVIPLVANHMVHFETPTPRAVRRLASRLAPETIEGLGLVMTADSFGRPPKPKKVPESLARLLAMARDMALAVDKPSPLMRGRDLVARGYPPGKTLGRMLDQAFEAQLDGAFSTREGAWEWLRRRFPREASPPRTPSPDLGNR